MTKILNGDKSVTNVGMGGIAIVTEGHIGRAVLGSCVGLVLYCEQRKIGAMAHVVLPEQKGATNTPGKFVDSAIPEMLKQLSAKGITQSQLSAKLAGGSSMFANSNGMEIGKSNSEKANAILHELKIKVSGQDVGGKKGRRILFDPADCHVQIEKAGEPAVTI